MASDCLYELAFQYKQTKLWKKLYDSDMFAVPLENGETAWCCVMGNGGEHTALAAYVGNLGLSSWYELTDLATTSYDDGPSEEMLRQSCLQCSFEDKELIPDESLKEIRAWAKEHHIALRGSNPYPQFINYTPYLAPWPADDKDEAILCQVLQAALYVSKQLEEKTPRDLGFADSYAHKQTIPCVTKDADGYRLGSVLMEKPKAKPMPAPKLTDELLTARFMACPKSGTFQCKLICLPNPILSEESDRPYFPFVVLNICEKSQLCLPTKPFGDYFHHPKDALNALMTAFCENDARPSAISVYDWDDRTYRLLEDMCEKCHIKLNRRTTLWALDDLEASIYADMDEEITDKIDMFVNMIDSLYLEDLKTMPDDFRQELKIALEQGGDLLPENTRRKLELALRN